MVIKEERPITMSEVVALAGDSEKAKAMKDFMRFYTKRNKEYSKFDQMLRRHNL